MLTIPTPDLLDCGSGVEQGYHSSHGDSRKFEEGRAGPVVYDDYNCAHHREREHRSKKEKRRSVLAGIIAESVDLGRAALDILVLKTPKDHKLPRTHVETQRLRPEQEHGQDSRSSCSIVIDGVQPLELEGAIAIDGPGPRHGHRVDVICDGGRGATSAFGSRWVGLRLGLHQNQNRVSEVVAAQQEGAGDRRWSGFASGDGAPERGHGGVAVVEEEGQHAASRLFGFGMSLSNPNANAGGPGGRMEKMENQGRLGVSTNMNVNPGAWVSGGGNRRRLTTVDVDEEARLGRRQEVEDQSDGGEGRKPRRHSFGFGFLHLQAIRRCGVKRFLLRQDRKEGA